MGNFIDPQYYYPNIRPGKVYSLFPISHFLNFGAGGQLLFIIMLIMLK